jgi:cytochrome P450
VLRDARFYSDPDTFDGLRFYNLRQQPGQENSHQYVSSTDTFLGFGNGMHICPGRYRPLRPRSLHPHPS